MRKTIPILLFVFLLTGLCATGTQAQGIYSERGTWLGATIQTVDRDLAEAFHLSSKSGVILNRILEDSPADKAGLQRDDIIIRADGRNIDDEEDLRGMLRRRDDGDKVTFTILREGREVDIEVTLKSRASTTNSRKRVEVFSDDDDNANRFFTYRFGGGDDDEDDEDNNAWVWRYDDDDDRDLRLFRRGTKSPWIGVMLSDLSDQLADYFGADEGVLITEIVEDSPAEKAGLKAGDVIVEAGGRNVEGSNDLQQAVRRSEIGENIEVVVLRDHNRVPVEVTVGESDDSFLGSFIVPDIPSIPDIDIPDVPSPADLPRMRGLHRGNGDYWFDSDELRKELDELRRELKEMQKELRKDFRDAEKEIRKEAREQRKKERTRIKNDRSSD